MTFTFDELDELLAGLDKVVPVSDDDIVRIDRLRERIVTQLVETGKFLFGHKMPTHPKLPPPGVEKDDYHRVLFARLKNLNRMKFGLTTDVQRRKWFREATPEQTEAYHHREQLYRNNYDEDQYKEYRERMVAGGDPRHSDRQFERRG